MMQLPLPARQFHLPKTILVFAQPDPPVDERAKLRLRRAAQKAAHDLYFMHVMVEPPFYEVDTLGRYLFGIPGFKGHIVVIPYKTHIAVELPLAPEMGLEEAVELVKKAAAKLGWRLLVVKQNSHVKEVPIMQQLIELCNKLLAETPIVLHEDEFKKLVKDEEILAALSSRLEQLARGDFDVLDHPDIHSIIADAVENYLNRVGELPLRGRYAFAEWFAEMMTGWSTRFANEHDVIKAEKIFSQAAFNSPVYTVRIYLLNNETLAEYLPNIQRGVAAVYNFCKELE